MTYENMAQQIVEDMLASLAVRLSISLKNPCDDLVKLRSSMEKRVAKILADNDDGALFD